MGPGMVPSGGLPPLPPAPGGGGALGFGLDSGFGGFNDGDGHLLSCKTDQDLQQTDNAVA